MKCILHSFYSAKGVTGRKCTSLFWKFKKCTVGAEKDR